MQHSTQFLETIVCGLRALVRWNARSSRAMPVWLIAGAAGLVCWLYLFAYISSGARANSPPDTTGDEVDYDSLAWELSQDHGFRTDFSSAKLREPYGAAADTLQHSGPRICLYRPPLYPWLLSLVNRVCGRQFSQQRLLNVTATAVTCAVVVVWAYQLGGPLPALLAIVHLLIVDWRIRFHSRAILTEIPAALLVALLMLALLRHERRASLATAAAVGLIAGLSTLNRSMCVLWIPVLMWLAAPGFDASETSATVDRLKCNHRPRWLYPAVVLITSAAVIAPWAARNIRLLGWRLPLGTQASLEAPAGYGDGALRRLGLWTNLHSGMEFPPDADPVELVAAEREQAIANSAQAMHWAAGHWYQLPLLAVVKVFSELRPWGIGELYISAFALLGLLSFRSSPLARVSLGLFAACLLGIAVTWSAAGRFIVPLLPSLHLFAAVGVWSAVEGVIHRQTGTCGPP